MDVFITIMDVNILWKPFLKLWPQYLNHMDHFVPFVEMF